MAEEYNYGLKIPKERIAVLIGKDGETKKRLEAATGTRINVDSKEGDVSVSGNDSLKIYSAQEVIKAISRGFNPEIALLLLKGDFLFELILIKDYAKGENSFLRLKGRVIGKEGKSRHVIEGLTDTYISVYGKTIGIIGEVADVMICKKGIESLLRGAKHGNVYSWLEKQKKKKVQAEGFNMEGAQQVQDKKEDSSEDIESGSESDDDSEEEAYEEDDT